MTRDEARVQAVAGLGYTTRQAQFLVRVALPGGYFLRRQYVTFTGHAHGQAAVRFLDHAMTRQHVRALPYGRHGRVFHLYARSVYAAIGEEHNRNRRDAEWEAVTRKLMTLDFVLAHPGAEFCATEEDKAELLRELKVPQAAWPARHYEPKHAGRTGTTRYFVDKMPWYRTPDDGRLWLAYIDAERTLHGFETFLAQYRQVLSAVPSGIAYVAPTVWRSTIDAAVSRVLGAGGPGRPDASAVREYFTTRQRADAGQVHLLTVAQINHFHRLRERCATPVFDALYARWRERPDGSLSSTEVADALRGNCALLVHALGRRYDATAAPKRSNGERERVT